MAANFPDAAVIVENAGFEAACYLPLQLGDRVVGTMALL